MRMSSQSQRAADSNLDDTGPRRGYEEATQATSMGERSEAAKAAQRPYSHCVPSSSAQVTATFHHVNASPESVSKKRVFHGTENAGNMEPCPEYQSAERGNTIGNEDRESNHSAKRVCTELKNAVHELFFLDTKHARNCAWGLNKELTRTSEGGSDKIRITELAEIVRTLRRAVRGYQAKVEQLHTSIARLEEESKSTDGKKVDSNSSAVVASLESKVQQMSAALATANTRVETLQAEIAAKESSPSDGSSVTKEECLKLEAELRDVKAKNKQLAVEMTSFQSRSTSEGNKLKKHIRDAEGEVARYKEKCTDLMNKVLALETSERQSKTAMERYQLDIQALREKHNQNVVSANKGELWQQMMQTKNETDSKMRSLQEQIVSLHGELESANSRIELQAQQVQNLEADKAAVLSRVQAAEAEVDAAEKKCLDASKENVVVNAKLSDITQAFTGQKKRADQLAVENEELQERADQLKRKLESEVSQSEDHRYEIESQRKTILQLRQELDALSSDQQLMKDALKDVQGERDKLDVHLSEALQELERSAGDRTVVEQEKAALRTAFNDSEAEKDALNNELREVQARATAATAAAKESEDKVTALEGQMEALQEALGLGGQREMVGHFVNRVGQLETALWDSEKARRRIHNELVEIKGNIRVFCRLRPSPGDAAVEALHGDGVRCMVEGKNHDFFFDRVLTPSTTQEAVFNGVSDVIQSALDGYNVCLFSYGQTGSGKTFTMNGTTSTPGIIPRAVSMILQTTSKLSSGGWEFRLEASFIEVYNEGLRDLLSTNTRPGTSGGQPLDSAAIKHDPKGHTQVAGATKLLINTEDDAKTLLAQAQKARSTDATAMNAESSRSHSIFTLFITVTHEANGVKLLGSLNLVDLAGSERLARSQAEGQRQKEACAINKSLSCLGDIFQALKSKSNHIPYRNSKLTYLLQPCLGGDGKTLMFVNINPEPRSAYESLCALRFASKVNSVETAASQRGGAKRNVVSTNADSSSNSAATGPSSLPPINRGTTDASLGSRLGLPRPSVSRPGALLSHQNSTPARAPSLGKDRARPSVSASGLPTPSRSTSVPAFRRQR